MDRTEQDKSTNRSGTRGLSSLGDITGDLLKNALQLIRDEIRMATAETWQKVSAVGNNSILMIVGGFVLYAGLLVLLAAAVIGLATIIPTGWAALAIGVATLIIGGILLAVGKRKLRGDMLPRQTIDNAKEDTKWMRNKLT